MAENFICGNKAAVTLTFACRQVRQLDRWLLYLITDCYVVTGKLMNLAADISLFLPFISTLESYMRTVGRTEVKIPLELMTSLTV
jgi:hypothetical protein